MDKRSLQKPHYVRQFLLASMVALLAMLPFYLRDGFLYFGFDFLEQQIPFNQICNQAVKQGSLLWNGSLDLGCSFLDSYSFYVLGSPFFWLSLIFPPQAAPIYVGLFLAVKIGVAAVTSYAWIRRYAKSENWAMLGGLLYAFSGYQITNLNFNHFADVTALFPLLLIALDYVMQSGGKAAFGIFALAVGVLTATNSVFFVGTVIFLILYFGVMLWCGQYKLTVPLFVRLAVESVLGVGLAGVLLVPTVTSLLGNPRASETFSSVSQMLFYKPIIYADLLRSMLFPAEAIGSRAFFSPQLTNDPEFYLPLLGLIPAFAWCWKHKDSWISRLLAVCAVFSIVPILNSLFVAGNVEYYPRWHYMPILVICLATTLALEDTKLSLRPGFVFYATVFGLFIVDGLIWKYYFKVPFVVNWLLAVVFTVMALVGVAVCALLRKLQSKRWGYGVIKAMVLGVAMCTVFMNIHYLQKYWQETERLNPAQMVADSRKLTFDEDENWRIDSSESFLNLGLYLDTPTMSSFSSTVSTSIFDFYDAMGIPRTIRSFPLRKYYGMRAFLSTKYVVQSMNDIKIISPMEGTKLLYEQDDFQVYENENFIPMGYQFEYSVDTELFQSLETTGRKDKALVKALVLTPEQQQKYAQYLTPIQKASDLLMSKSEFANQAGLRRDSACDSFERTKQGYRATIDMERENLVFFSIPYDSAWKATVNGQECPIERVSYGFMAVLAPAGPCEIEFKYVPTDVYFGLGISLVSAILLVGASIYWKKHCISDTIK